MIRQKSESHLQLGACLSMRHVRRLRDVPNRPYWAKSIEIVQDMCYHYAIVCMGLVTAMRSRAKSLLG